MLFLRKNRVQNLQEEKVKCSGIISTNNRTNER